MDLNDLLSRLKSPDNQLSSNGQPSGAVPVQQSTYRQPFISSPLMSPPLASPQPQSTSNLASSILSTGNTSDRVTSERTANLLNLLKFNQPGSGGANGSQTGQGVRDGENMRSVSTSSAMPPLAATSALSPLHRGEARQKSFGALPIMTRDESPLRQTSDNPQEILLKLINRPQGTPSGMKRASTEMEELSRNERDNAKVVEPTQSDAAVRVFGGLEEQQNTSFEPPQSNQGGPGFNYVNPFEQLAASSPRNKRTRLGGLSAPTTPDTGLKTGSASVAMGASAPTPTPLPDGRSQVEALLGIGVSKGPSETVTQALSGVGEQADKEAQEALARAALEQESTQAEILAIGNNDDTTHLKDLQKAVHEVALEINDELKDEGHRASLEATMPNRVAHAMEETANATTQENIADSWESADAEDNSVKDDTDVGVRVFNFPMKPFVSIDINNLPAPARVVRQDIVMKIASMKREFDQVDRTLASATANFIVYAMARGGGLRIIRQEDGNNKQVFRKAEHKIYNVNISAPAAGPLSKSSENVLATGVNGSVYWTSIGVSREVEFEEEEIDQNGFIFPPLTSSDENTSGAQLKTRAKQSSRHPEYFAVSRGKSIHIIWPSIATSTQYIDEKSRVVDSDKYLSHCCLKIATGKSGKDFAFSEDDTVIVSLDKAGRLKFWDIREHTRPFVGTEPGIYRHVETKEPLLVLSTTSAAEKSWATSVQFVDKERPMSKGLALRYLLVGSKQNHTLQLWDIGLGRPVQELNFPHESETDAICSVAYHAKSGIVAVGHPTRNSIFLIHLSSPKYNLGGIAQAEYVQRLASKDQTLPKPESTAIMSGLREISLSSLGDLRSLDIAEPGATPAENLAEGGETIFEIYVATSRGVSCLSFKKQDLGWDQDGKVLDGVDAAAEQIIEVRDLQMPQTEAPESNEVSAKATDSSTKTEPEMPSKEITKEDHKEKLSPGAKKSVTPATSIQKVPKQEIEVATKRAVENVLAGPTNGRKSKAASKVVEPVALDIDPKSEKENTRVEEEKPAVNGGAKESITLETTQTEPPQQLDTTMLGESISKALGNTLSAVFGSVLGDQLESLYKRFDDDKRVQDAAGAAKQDAVLRLVSSTLTENVEKSLSRIVATNIEQSILPALSKVTVTQLELQVGEAIKQHLMTAVPREMKSALQAPITKALQDPEVLRAITDQVTTKVATHVEQVFSTTLSKTIQPAFQKLATDTARKSSTEVERRVAEQLKQVNVQRQNDTAKIDQLTTLTTELLETVRAMAKTLTDSQSEILKLQSQLAERERLVTPVTQPAAVPTEPAVPRDEELDTLSEKMANGKLADGTIKWLQSSRRVELFDLFFVKYDPTYLRGMDQLITLSVAAAVTDSFETYVAERLTWLEVALSTIDTRDPTVAEYATKVLDILVQRLMDAYMAVAGAEPNNPLLVKIHALMRQVRTLQA